MPGNTARYAVTDIRGGVELDCVPARLQSLFEFSLAAEYRAHRGMGVRKVGVQAQRRLGGALPVLSLIVLPEHVPLGQGQCSPGLGVIRIDPDHAATNADYDFVVALVVQQPERRASR